MFKRTLLPAVVTLLGLGCVAAHADTVSGTSGATYTLTYSQASANSYYVYLQVDTTNYAFYTAGNPTTPVSPNYLQAVALELDPNQIGKYQPTVSLVTASPGFSTGFSTDSRDNANGCVAASALFFCDQYASNDLGAPAGPGDVYNFEFLVTEPTGGSLDFDLDGAYVEANYNYTSTNKSTGDVTEHNGARDDASITLTAATPEPSSLALLGTGVLGAAGVLRRRFKA